MINIKLLQFRLAFVRESLAVRGKDTYNIDRILELIARKRKLVKEIDEIKKAKKDAMRV